MDRCTMCFKRFATIIREPKGLPQGPFGPPAAVLRTLDPIPWLRESETTNLKNINPTLSVALGLVSAMETTKGSIS